MEEKILEIVTGIQQQLIVMQEDINVLKEDVTVLKEDVTDLKEDTAVLKEDVEYLKKQRIQDRKDIMEAFYNLEVNIQKVIDEAAKENREAIEYNTKLNSLEHENFDLRIRKLEFVTNIYKK